MGFRRILLTLLTLVALAVAGPVSALPVTFTGELNSAGRPLGTSATEALGGAAMAAGLMTTSILASQLDLLGTYGLSVTNDLTETLQVLPDSVDTIIGATQTAVGTVGHTVVYWSNLILVVTGIILLLVLNYIFSGMLKDLQDGWAMLWSLS